MKTDDLINILAEEGARKVFPAPAKILFVWFVIVALYAMALLGIHGLRPDIAEQVKRITYLADIMVASLIVITAAIASSYLALPDNNQKSWIRFLPFIPMAILILLAINNILHEDGMTLAECIKLHRYDCMKDVLIFSILPAIVMFYTINKEAPVQCCWAGSMAALAAASMGYILLRLIEIHDDPMQLIIWHFVPVLFIMFVGIIIGKEYLGRIWKR